MKGRNIYITVIMTLLTLVSCQEDELYTGPCEVKVRLYGKEHVEVTRSGMYVPLSESSPSFTAGLYVTMGNQTACCFPIEWNGRTWSGNIFLEKGDYTFYSCMPLREGKTAFNNGANDSFVLSKIPGLGTDDIMISNAAVTKTIDNDADIALSMKMDHIMACVSPQFYLHDVYADLRSIEIKAVEFAIFDGEKIDIPYYKATATYSKEFDIAWESDDAGDAEEASEKTDSVYETDEEEGGWVKVYDASRSPMLNKETTTKENALAFGNCYVSPIQSTEKLKMRVTYNVYDKTGVLVRENVQAVNSIKKLAGLSQENTLAPGYNYKLYVKIVPSYLYVLSDNDEVFVIND